MSFDSLPDEMVALVASHVNSTDIPQLLQSQKRICNIMKKHKMDRPAFEAMAFTFINQYRRNDPSTYQFINQITLICQAKQTKYSTPRVLFQKSYKNENWNDVLDLISKTRSIHFVLIRGIDCHIRLTEEIATRFNQLNTKIEKFTINRFKLQLSEDSFVRFCKNFTSVGLSTMVVFKELTYESILPRILSVTALHTFYPSSIDEMSLLFSKETFMTAILKNNFYKFQFGAFSPLTVNEIRFLVESVIERKAAFRMVFGMLSNDQLNDANEWLHYVAQNPGIPYRIKRRKQCPTLWSNHFQINFCGSVAVFYVRGYR